MEQAFVIIMGCAPTLSSITKLDIPFVSSLGASIKKLVLSRGSGSRTEASSGLGQSKSGIYYELGIAGKTASDVQASSKSTRSQTESNAPGTVRRTDQFEVRSDRVSGATVSVLPPSQIPLLTRPDKTKNGEWINPHGLLETTQLTYIIDDANVYQKLVHFDTVRKHIAPSDMRRLAAATAEETELAFHDI
ncbi:hypothetical protein CC86DRAFT_411673 [Ophiobolus disseminans]|uniref:Uncharacterized protein n=1 Tax=Ophiobolus disseminans TaxID=1469910 RepID=A0A6A6ZIX2_9PLEO|nr:hypothetical protein CC86DRAFT_411673 [Ophiobolus disseminans]